MIEGDDGNFGSDLSLPSNLNIDTTGITQTLYSNLYKHGIIFAESYEDLFDNEDNVEDLDDLDDYESPFAEGEDDG